MKKSRKPIKSTREVELEVTLREKQLIKIARVLQILDIGRSSLYDGIKRGDYPKPVKVGRRASRWPLAVILRLAEYGVQPGAFLGNT